MEEKSVRKTLWKKVNLLKLSNFTFFHNVFYAICILKSYYRHILVIVCNFFEFGTVPKWCNRELFKDGESLSSSSSYEPSSFSLHIGSNIYRLTIAESSIPSSSISLHTTIVLNTLIEITSTMTSQIKGFNK